MFALSELLEDVKPLKQGGNRDIVLLQREALWIHTLQTEHLRGMNVELLLGCFFAITYSAAVLSVVTFIYCALWEAIVLIHFLMLSTLKLTFYNKSDKALFIFIFIFISVPSWLDY